MNVRVVILGLPNTVHRDWELSHVPFDGGKGLARVIISKLPPEFREATLLHRDQPLETWEWECLESLRSSSRALEIVVVPPSHVGGKSPSPSLPSIQLLTTSGPDSGRSIPLARGTYTLGRGRTQLQIHDPYLPTTAATVTHSRHGVHLALPDGAPRRSPVPLRADLDTPSWGRSQFRIGLNEAAVVPLTTVPSPPSIPTDSEPAKPNIAIQAVTALSPLLIGTVMVLVTGHWFFLLFSVVSMLIAATMIVQYRRTRARFLASLHNKLHELSEQLETTAPSATDLALASRLHSADPLGLRSLPADPVIRWGEGQVTVRTEPVIDRKWRPDLTTTIPLVISLKSTKINIVGDPAETLPLARWIDIQLLRFSSPGIATSASPAPEIVRYTDDQWENTPPESDNPVVAFCTHRRLVAGGLCAEEVRFEGISQGTHAQLEYVVRNSALQLPAETVSLFRDTSQYRGSQESLRTSLGTRSHPLTVDLVDDGPHLLVVGTTGSGKSELLMSLLTHLAHDYPPSDLGLILLDFKGGASFVPLAGVPHTMAVETNLHGEEPLRSFSAISAELIRREELFLAAKVPDYATFRLQNPEHVLPRIVVAIDELRILFDEHPDANSQLARLAATGRSLGFHLILATQRAQGTVTSEIRSNIGSVVCLRTSTEQESWDLLGSGLASTIPTELPGRAYFRSGATSPREFHSDQPMCPDAKPSFMPVTQWAESEPASPPQPWHDVANYITRRSIAAGHLVPTPILTPELPQVYSPPRDVQTQAIDLGLLDQPTRRRQAPVLSFLDQPETTAWIGVESEALGNVFQRLVLAESQGPSPHMFIFDGSNYLDGDPAGEHVADRSIADVELSQLMDALENQLNSNDRVTVCITKWGYWADRRDGSTFVTFEERILRLLRDYRSNVRFFVFGNRELAGGRLIAHIDRRFYLPAETTPEQRIVWPTLLKIPHVPLRAVMVTPETVATGLAVQLATLPVSPSATSTQCLKDPGDGNESQ